MKSKILFGFIIVSMLWSLAFSTQDFNVSPSNINITREFNQSFEGIINIINIGNETLNITINSNNNILNLISGSNTLKINLNETNITNLLESETRTISYNYTTNISPGNYTGILYFVNDNNNSNNKSIYFNIEVLPQQQTTTNEYNFKIDGVDDTIIVYGELDDTVSKTITIINNGNKTLHDFQFDVTDLEGDDDEIRSNDIDWITDEGFDLAKNEEKNFRFEIDIDDDIEVDTYEGILTIRTNEITKNYTLKVKVQGGDYDINILDNSLDVRNGELEIYGEPGEYVTGYEFRVKNEGDFDVRNLYVKLDGDLTKESGIGTLDSSIVTFSPSTFDLDKNDDKDVDVKIRIPEDANSGDYLGDIEVYNENDEKMDDISLRLNVIGDLYIYEDITLSKDKVKPGDYLEVTIPLKNKGNSILRNVKITGYIYDIDSINSDLTEKTENFVINTGEKVEKKLRFKIPEEAIDGSKSLEIRVEYDGGNEINEIVTFDVVRPEYKIEIVNSLIRPKIVRCEKELYTYIKVKNYGKYEEELTFVSEIIGTDISKSSSKVTINPDETFEKSLVLDISDLKPGNYKVVNKIIYRGSLFKSFETNLLVENCSEDGAVIKPIETNQGNQINLSEEGGENKKEETYNIFGKEVEKTTVYLGSGLLITILLIFILLLLI